MARLIISGMLISACGPEAQASSPSTSSTITGGATSESVLEDSPAVAFDAFPIGARVADADSASDVSPYIVNPIVVAPVAANRSIECGTHITPDHAVAAGQPADSPARALDAFLQSGDGAQVQMPNPVQPFREYHISDGSIRFEHFVAWTQHVSVTVRPAAGEMWTVVSWSDTTC